MAMSSITQPSAIVLKGQFNAKSRKYPTWSFLEKCRDWFDSRDHDTASLADWYTDEFSMHTPHADKFESNADDHGYSGDRAFSQARIKLYAEPLGEHAHFNETLVAIGSSGGYDVYAQMLLFENVACSPAEGEIKVKDEKGKEWEVQIPMYYHFNLVKDSTAKHDGLKIRHISTIKDTGVVNDKLDARGIGHKRSIN